MSNVEVNDSSVMDLLNALNPEDNNLVLFNAIKGITQKIASSARRNLRASLGTGATSTKKYGSMVQGIKTKNEKDFCEASVHIMSDFRLKFFEKGTKQRKTKRGYNRGTIKAYNFFKEARNIDMDGIIDKSISTSLKRLER